MDMKTTDKQLQERRRALLLASQALARFRIERSVGPIDEALSYLDRASAAEGEDTESWNCRGRLYKNRYLASGEHSDLDNAVGSLRQAIELATTWADRAPALHNLGNTLQWRYQRWHEPLDLEDMVAAYRSALAAYPRRHPDRIVVISALATALRIRGRTWAKPEDLSLAIRMLRRSIRSPNCRGLRRANTLNNLVAALIDRGQNSGSLRDLDAAVEFGEQAAESASAAPSLDAIPITANLSMALRQRHRLRPNPGDVARAGELALANLRETSPAHPEWIARANTLAGLLRERYIADRSDGRALDRAIALFWLAARRSRGSLVQPDVLYNLGVARRDRWRDRGQQTDLEHAIVCWETARASVYERTAIFPLDYQLGGIATWSRLNSDLIDAYFLLADDGREEAVWGAFRIAETAKSRILATNLARGGLPRPTGVPKELLDRESSLLEALARLDRDELTADTESNRAGARGLVLWRDRLDTDLREVWGAISRCDPAGKMYVGLRTGLPETKQTIPALPPSTIGLAFWTDESWTAVFVLDGDRLRGFRVKAGRDVWEKSLSDLRREVEGRRRLRPRWDERLAQILDPVRERMKGAVRIVVSPGGSANLIPWQAALAAMRPSSIPLAEVELVPSLLMRRPSSPRPAVHPLVVGDPARRHEKEHLKYARAEAHEVAGIYGTVALIGTKARRGTIARLARSSSPVHLAAHAYFDQAVPLRSGVLLSDGYLTASDLLTVGLLPGLIVISACHAGASSSVAGEERMGFPQAALLAGAREVIVPLWEVDDETTRKIMVGLHTKLRAGASASMALAEVLDEARRLGAERRWWAPFQLVTVLSALEPNSFALRD